MPTRGVTWGEGDFDKSASAATAVIKTASTDTIASDAGPTSFATQVSLNTDLVGIAVGDALRVTCRGVFGTFGIAGSLRVELRNSGTALLDTGAQTVAAGLTARGWWLEGLLVGLTASTSECQGTFHFSNSGRLAESMDMENAGTIAAGIGSGNLTVTVTWGTADADNTITLRQFVAEHIGG